MDGETIEKIKKLIRLLDTIWTSINEWYENKSLLELP